MPNEPHPSDGRRHGRRVPFLGHQIAEYVVAVALVAVGFHLNGGAELALAGAGIALLVLNIVTAGPLGAVTLLNRHLHHAGDLVIAAVLVVAPFLVYGDLHFGGIVLCEAAAALIVWMERATLYGESKRSLAGVSRGESTEQSEPGVIESARIAAEVLTPEVAKTARQAARRIGFVTGVTRRVVRDRRNERRSDARPKSD